MRRGYIRERAFGPTMEVQRASLAAAGVPTDGARPPVYMDMMKDTKRTIAGIRSLAQLARAIKSLRQADADELVVHDAATLGRDHEEITEALAEIGKRGCKLIVWTPEPRDYVWHPDAAEIASVAGEGAKIIRAEKHRRAASKHLGAQPKLVGKVLAAAREAWADPNLTAPQAAKRVYEVTGVKVSARLMWKLGKKSEAEGRLT